MSGTGSKLWPKCIHKFLKNSEMSFMSFIRKSWASLDMLGLMNYCLLILCYCFIVSDVHINKKK